jgi:hypothetical protein
MEETFKVKFLFARKDHSWSTETIDIPSTLDGAEYCEVEHWVEQKLIGCKKYKDIAAIKIHDVNYNNKLFINSLEKEND